MNNYADWFWRPEIESTLGTDALIKRNHDSKHMCQDLEDYFRKRAKLELDYSKSLAVLTKCFRDRDDMSVLEVALTTLKGEIDTISRAHMVASEQFQTKADGMKKFRDEQCTSRKLVEESLTKAQAAKISNWTKTIQAQKAYTKRCTERDAAELACREKEVLAKGNKDLEKLQSKAIRSEEEASKAESLYKASVMVLNGSQENWEKEMIKSCECIQELDEERIREIRKQVWLAVNVDSKLALDIDDRCEVVRGVLENCDIDTEIQIFIQQARTGCLRPDSHEFVHYSKQPLSSNSDRSNHLYASMDELFETEVSESSSNNIGKYFKGSALALGVGKAIRKRFKSSSENLSQTGS